ncbi:MAG TPA: endonuclease/exonuclease/phosphatase family protein [Isosphaeraceae bacterium]|jgi:hypothetical protein|nr:endonuclease/exonuclease/phosphatase family protein [Isosphaeraceae bacterium]
MMSFLFWNLNKKPLQDRVAQLVGTHDVDVVMLAECAIDMSEVIDALNAAGVGGYHSTSGQAGVVHVLSRMSPDSIVDHYDTVGGRMSIKRVAAPRFEFLLAIAHLPSRVNAGVESLNGLLTQVSKEIDTAEDTAGHRRTILVGDLNMNPFDSGMIGAFGLHGVMTRDLARRQYRKVQTIPRPFFYNPMWGCFGDRTEGPAGTFYRGASEAVNPFWNMYDQVLLRPGLMNHLDCLKILVSDGYDPLISNRGLPKASDHLPLFFRLDV